MRTLVILILIVVSFLAVAFKQNSYYKPVPAVCVNEPDPLHIVLYNSNEYRRIHTDTPIFHQEIPAHLLPTTPAELFVKDRYRPSYIPAFDFINNSRYWVTWRPTDGVMDLLFVDMSATRPFKEPGIRYFDIYLRANARGQYVIPTFIRSYCDLKLPVAPKTIYPDQYGNFFPPPSFVTNNLISWQDGINNTDRPPANTHYYLFAYEVEGSASYALTVGTSWPSAQLIITGNNGVTKRYKAHYVSTSVIKYIGLVDMDAAAGPKTAYKYTYPTEEFKPEHYPLSINQGYTVRQNLQLETLNYPTIPSWGWWTPECKPAIYLYPPKTTQVHVTVKPLGYLTYTDPVYPPDGWSVTAAPDGTITSNEKTYPYLYYESHIYKTAVKKPNKGYVVAYDALPALYEKILPQLGLNAVETKDFVEYWDGLLPEAPYYFVGIMDEAAIDKIEPLTISPKEDTIIRVRVFFEALNEKKEVQPPVLTVPKRAGFTVVEWGGMVQTDKDYPFMCSQ